MTHEMLTLTEAVAALNTTHPTLSLKMKRLGIQPHADPMDQRVRLLDREQVARLRKVLMRSRQPNAKGGAMALRAP